MPRKAKALSALEVKRLKCSGGTKETHAVGEVAGLYLVCYPTGSRNWILRTKVAGKRREFGLGGFPDVPLAQAREKARALKLQLSEGTDPVIERRAAQAKLEEARLRSLTFAEALDRYMAVKLEEFKRPKYRKQWWAAMDRHVLPVLGTIPVSEITVRDMLRCLEPIWRTKTDTASRLRGRVENVLNWATVAGHRTGDNPARWQGNLKELLPEPSKIAPTRHQPSVPVAQAPAWFADLRSREGIGSRALEFLALTAVRSGEVRGATWDELSDDGIWTIPAIRMKMGKEHRVPLSTQALALLDALPRLGPLVFTAPRGGQLSDMTLSATMRRVGYMDGDRLAVPHGLRATFRSWAADYTEADPMLAEVALAHSVGGSLGQAYLRSRMVERRRGLMQEWADYLDSGAPPA